MKSIIIFLISISAFGAVDPALYADFDSYYQALILDNPSWVDTPSDRNNLISKEFSVESIKASHFNSKIEALSKKNKAIKKHRDLIVLSNRYTNGVTTNGTAVTFACPKTGNYMFSTVMNGLATTPFSRFSRAGVTIKNGSTSGHSGIIYPTQIYCTAGQTLGIHYTAYGGGTSVTGFYRLVELP